MLTKSLFSRSMFKLCLVKNKKYLWYKILPSIIKYNIVVFLIRDIAFTYNSRCKKKNKKNITRLLHAVLLFIFKKGKIHGWCRNSWDELVKCLNNHIIKILFKFFKNYLFYLCLAYEIRVNIGQYENLQQLNLFCINL